eukprot:CAMPEP_0113475296 /NCGR_PEP_ID=MMETSP0014_2-20120614/19046_1 /TAXON_ID=2857 /ORGANISM="Nitzschia sp." /LENGTH=728 /DNA_ID=CAMNT_0000368209 /DNA_START=226 /DNA_END=2412 /DNA_ORIENTATION=+ /assembly_acc=CAM_ASM_000159
MPLPSESIHSEEDLNEWENSENDHENDDQDEYDDDDDGFNNGGEDEDEDEDVDDSQQQDYNDDGDDDGDVSSEDEEGYNTNDDDDEKYYDDQNGEEEADEEGEEYDEDQEPIDEYGDENEYDAMVVNEEEHFYDEEYEDDVKVVEERQRNERLLMLLICCCCCFLLWATIGLSLGLWRALRKDDPAPTPAPNNTFFFIDTDNNDPTSAPTDTIFTGVPDRVINDPPSRDTTIFETGPNATIPQGGSDTVLVQNGAPDDPTMPRAHALINFHWNETGHPWYNPEQLDGYVTKAQMCLQRQPDEPVSGNIEYSVCRLPNFGIDVENDLERLTGSMNTFDLPGNCFSTPTRFEVNQRSTTIEEYCVDVTPFMAAHPPFQPEIQRGLRSSNSGRQLQREDYRNVLFVVFNYVDEQYGSDRFYSKEAGERAPKLILDIFRDPGTAATAPPTPFPTPGPTFEPQVPVPDGPGTRAPSQSNAPSDDLDLGDYEIINIGCSICPLYGEKPSENWPIKVENMIRPGMVGDEVPCQELDIYCKEGYCDEQVCQGTAYVSEMCGCQVDRFAVVDNRELCNVCGEPNMVMQNPNTFVTIPDSLSPPGFGTRVICSRMLQAGYVGFYSPTQCTILPTYLKDECGCVPGEEGYDDGLQDGLCNICGENMDMTNPDGVATIPDEIAIPGKDTTLTCSQIQNACDNNECDPIVHCVPFPALFADVCGCASRVPTDMPSAAPSIV